MQMGMLLCKGSVFCLCPIFLSGEYEIYSQNE